MIPAVLKFALRLLVLLLLILTLHLAGLYSLSLPMFDHLLLPAYGINWLLAVLIFVAIEYFKKINKNALGFLFMAGSLLKFAVFFLVFYPVYKADSYMSSTEFLSFFVPYATCLVFEVAYITKMLNKM